MLASLSCKERILQNNKFKWFDVRYISEDKADQLRRSSVKLGDILIIKIGSIGYAAELTDLKDYPFAIIPANLAKLTLNEDVADKSYILHWLASASVKRHFESVASRTAQPALSLSKIKALPVPLPPLAEQKRIAAILDKADQLRQKRQQAIALADEFLRSVFLDMFGDPVTNPKGWEVRKIERLAASGKNAIKAGPFGSALKKEDYTPTGYKIYGQEQVIRDDLTYGDYFISEEKYRSLENCKIVEGDLLISLVGTFGKISIVPAGFEPGIINPRLMKITPDHNQVIPRFLKFLLQTDGAMAKIKHMSHGGTMGIVNVGKMKGLELPIPPIDQQQRVSKGYGQNSCI